MTYLTSNDKRKYSLQKRKDGKHLPFTYKHHLSRHEQFEEKRKFLSNECTDSQFYLIQIKGKNLFCNIFAVLFPHLLKINHKEI